MKNKARSKERGQGILELALTFPMVFVIIMGILELGLAFNAYVTLVSAAREGARGGAVYLYQDGYSPQLNDQNRQWGTGTSQPYTENIRDTVARSLGILNNTAPNFDKNSNITVTYIPDPPILYSRRGDLVSVRVTYQYQFLTKLIGNQPAITLTAEATARIE